MMIRGRTLLAAIVASSILLLSPDAAFPSTNTEAGHKLTVARERLAELKKTPRKKRYRSYWIDCIRIFELVEKKYPRSPAAADACFERAGVYQELFQNNRHSRDLSKAIRAYGSCRSDNPRHSRAPEAFYRMIVLTKDFKKDSAGAMDLFKQMTDAYPDNNWTGKARTRLGLRTASRTQKKEAEIRKAPEAVITGQKGPAVSGVVKNIRHWSGGAYTRIVIDQDAPLKFMAHELKNPDRLVFDILNARIDDSIEKDPLPVNDGILKQVRSSQFQTDIVRVVLDLASLKSYAAFPLHDPERLVIDVTGVQSESEESPDVAAAGTVPTTSPLESLKEPSAQSNASDAKGGGGKQITLSQQMGLKITTIAIDAGHGGRDPGALGKGGLREKDITLDIARRLAALVKERLGRKVIMTRENDVYIPLEDRPFIAKSKGADLFVSIHVNANRKRNARGIETYIQGLRASDTEAMATAARENAMSTRRLSELKDELSKILKDLAASDKSEESLHLAHAVHGSLVSTVKQTKKKLIVKRAFFYVLVNTQMPSILAEVGFISNAEEEALLRKEAYRQKLAEALFQGIKRYVESRDPRVI